MGKSIEEKRKYFKDSIYLKYENEVNSKSNKFVNHKKRYVLSKLQKVAVVIIVGMVSLSASAQISGNFNFEKIGLLKLSQNYDESKIDIEKTIELENCDITLNSMAGDASYIVAEYTVKFKNDILSTMTPIEKDDISGYRLSFDKKIIINLEEVTNVIERAEKVSENEYIITQIINVMEIEDNNINLEINLDRIYIGGKYITTDENAIRIGKKIEAKVELDVDINKNVIAETKVDEHTKIIVEKIANTKFQTYITFKKVTQDITMEEYEKENPMEYNSFIISTKDDEVLPYVVYDSNTAGEETYTKENGEYKPKKYGRIQSSELIKVEENFIVMMNADENVDKIKITPIKTRIYEDRKRDKDGLVEETKMYNKATWYPLEVGEKKYSATSDLGGIFEIEKIDADDNNIYFYYNQHGLIGNEWKILIREKNQKLNYLHSTNEEKKGLNSGENRIIFAKDPSYTAGAGLHMERLDNFENLEFTLLFGCENTRVGDEIILDAPKLVEKTAKISDLKFTDIKLKLTLDELTRQPEMSSKYIKKEDLSTEYSKEEAIKDGCFVVEEQEIISEDKDQLDKFIENCDNEINGVIRIYHSSSSNRNQITDIEYTDGVFFIDKYYVENKRSHHSDYYGYSKMIKDKDENEGIYNYSLENSNRFFVICKVKM